jgi:hypothetical protein
MESVMTQVFWLVLVFSQTSGSSISSNTMHVGNFTSLAACEAAAQNAWNTPWTVLGTSLNFVCVQANDGTNPPS